MGWSTDGKRPSKSPSPRRAVHTLTGAHTRVQHREEMMIRAFERQLLSVQNCENGNGRHVTEGHNCCYGNPLRMVPKEQRAEFATRYKLEERYLANVGLAVARVSDRGSDGGSPRPSSGAPKDVQSKKVRRPDGATRQPRGPGSQKAVRAADAAPQPRGSSTNSAGKNR